MSAPTLAPPTRSDPRLDTAPSTIAQMSQPCAVHPLEGKTWDAVEKALNDRDQFLVPAAAPDWQRQRVCVPVAIWLPSLKPRGGLAALRALDPPFVEGYVGLGAPTAGDFTGVPGHAAGILL